MQADIDKETVQLILKQNAQDVSGRGAAWRRQESRGAWPGVTPSSFQVALRLPPRGSDSGTTRGASVCLVPGSVQAGPARCLIFLDVALRPPPRGSDRFVADSGTTRKDPQIYGMVFERSLILIWEIALSRSILCEGARGAVETPYTFVTTGKKKWNC